MSDYSDQVLAAFVETLDLVGIDITFNGTTKKKSVVTGPIEFSRDQQLAGDLPKFGTTATMRSTDFAALGLDVRSEVTIAGAVMVVIKVDKDPADPLTDFVLI